MADGAGAGVARRETVRASDPRRQDIETASHAACPTSAAAPPTSAPSNPPAFEAAGDYAPTPQPGSQGKEDTEATGSHRENGGTESSARDVRTLVRCFLLAPLLCVIIPFLPPSTPFNPTPTSINLNRCLPVLEQFGDAPRRPGAPWRTTRAASCCAVSSTLANVRAPGRSCGNVGQAPPGGLCRRKSPGPRAGADSRSAICRTPVGRVGSSPSAARAASSLSGY